ncbi:hypothetical protein E2C01_013033 [Portunus trituberculatus]|uniref:Uncharacterized protein n=1 Tax=Portunus trituberculatus TaxID=210409 RepID=A0A5B7DF88_PORTR|nr:hypothetical protein [Portunus trituberculatus]
MRHLQHSRLEVDRCLHPDSHSCASVSNGSVEQDTKGPRVSDETARRYPTERAQSSLFPIFG